MFDPSQSKRVEIKTTTCEKDLGVYIDSELKFSQHTKTQTNKANRIVGLIRRSFTHLDIHSFKILFVALVRPHLEYCGTVYNPRLLKDKRRIENILRRASKLLPGLRELPYEQRLHCLKLPSMKYRLIRGDLIEVFNWFQSYYACQTKLFAIEDRVIQTRGHSYKLKKKFCRLESRKHFFVNRVIDKWNSLPDEIVCASSLNAFKNRLDKFLNNEIYVTTNFRS